MFQQLICGQLFNMSRRIGYMFWLNSQWNQVSRIYTLELYLITLFQTITCTMHYIVSVLCDLLEATYEAVEWFGGCCICPSCAEHRDTVPVSDQCCACHCQDIIFDDIWIYFCGVQVRHQPMSHWKRWVGEFLRKTYYLVLDWLAYKTYR